MQCRITCSLPEASVLSSDQQAASYWHRTLTLCIFFHLELYLFDFLKFLICKNFKVRIKVINFLIFVASLSFVAIFTFSDAELVISPCKISVQPRMGDNSNEIVDLGFGDLRAHF